ncbi:hypothetical protein ABZ719_37580 [Streptomyces sp. NPDC006743]|uniref:hypothetical protein n=1 Tax=Streptomyces sp. NPDC006743 TaxID=3154480 RepID=UPI0034567589
MTAQNELRLLPWSGPDGKPGYLSSDDGDSYMSRLADNTETAQLGMATQILDHARDVLGGSDSDPEELRSLAAELTLALRDTLRVATSRGGRLR